MSKRASHARARNSSVAGGIRPICRAHNVGVSMQSVLHSEQTCETMTAAPRDRRAAVIWPGCQERIQVEGGYTSSAACMTAVKSSEIDITRATAGCAAFAAACRGYQNRLHARTVIQHTKTPIGILQLSLSKTLALSTGVWWWWQARAIRVLACHLNSWSTWQTRV